MSSKSVQRRGRVVVGVDDSPAARAALALAVQEAAWRGGELHVISVWSMPGGHTSHASVPGPLRDACVEEARTLADRLVQEILGSDPPAPVVVAVGEPPAARALVEASERADLVVVGSRGRGRLARLVAGSVSAEVVHDARCPVTVVPPPRHPHDRAPEDLEALP